MIGFYVRSRLMPQMTVRALGIIDRIVVMPAADHNSRKYEQRDQRQRYTNDPNYPRHVHTEQQHRPERLRQL